MRKEKNLTLLNWSKLFTRFELKLFIWGAINLLRGIWLSEQQGWNEISQCTSVWLVLVQFFVQFSLSLPSFYGVTVSWSGHATIRATNNLNQFSFKWLLCHLTTSLFLSTFNVYPIKVGSHSNQKCLLTTSIR